MWWAEEQDTDSVQLDVHCVIHPSNSLTSSNALGAEGFS